MAKRPRKKTYVEAPELPQELARRYRVTLEVLSGAKTVSQAARELSLSRNHFQSLMHRAEAGLIQGLTPQPAGRPETPVREAELLKENAQLKREAQRLGQRVEMIDRLMTVAGNVLKGRAQALGRSRRGTPSSSATETSSDEDG